MAIKKNRSMKVMEQSGYRYKPTPTIMLKGKWLASISEIMSLSAVRMAGW